MRETSAPVSTKDRYLELPIFKIQELGFPAKFKSKTGFLLSKFLLSLENFLLSPTASF